MNDSQNGTAVVDATADEAARMKQRKVPSFIPRFYPEFEAGGYSRFDQIVAFYGRVNALLHPSMDVLEFGAGRGKWNETLTGFRRELAGLRDKCNRLVGVDVDPVVTQNPMLHEAKCFSPGEPIPCDDQQFDLIVSWAVFEHIQDAQFYANELGRVLKPGGWICAWTPNKWGYVGIGARLVPTKMQVSLLRFFTPSKKAEDSFPTVYRLNSLKALRRLFPESGFRHCSYVYNGPPVYHANRPWLARLWQLYGWIMPPSLGQSLHVFIQKRHPQQGRC